MWHFLLLIKVQVMLLHVIVHHTFWQLTWLRGVCCFVTINNGWVVVLLLIVGCIQKLKVEKEVISAATIYRYIDISWYSKQQYNIFLYWFSMCMCSCKTTILVSQVISTNIIVFQVTWNGRYVMNNVTTTVLNNHFSNTVWLASIVHIWL